MLQVIGGKRLRVAHFQLFKQFLVRLDVLLEWFGLLPSAHGILAELSLLLLSDCPPGYLGNLFFICIVHGCVVQPVRMLPQASVPQWQRPADPEKT